jgi:hypothetical protein
MITRCNRDSVRRTTGTIAGALLWVCAAGAAAQEAPLSATDLLDAMPGTGAAEPFVPFPLVGHESSAGLTFDLAGSDHRKMQLELSEPLTLDLATGYSWRGPVAESVTLGTSLDWLLSDDVGVSARVQRGRTQAPFQAVGSIHCQNGILEAGSYRASDCYFVNDANALDIGSVSLGTNYRVGNQASAAINVFRRESSMNSAGIRRRGNLGGAPVLDAGLLTPVLTNPLLPGVIPSQPLQYLDNEVTGIDLEFQVGVSTTKAGDMRLGLQLTRILDGTFEALYPDYGSLQRWSVAEPVDSARMSFDWSKGAFSGGIQSFYREPVEFMNQDALESVTTFDVHFTWRTPWNASLSVGATNVLNAGVDENGNTESKLSDPFESVYGRIPYVRYQQDL